MSRGPDRPRVVFDCNVLLQAAANEAGPAARALGLLDRNLIDVYVSRAVLKEFREVLRYPTVREKLPSLTEQRIDEFLKRFLFRARLVRKVSHAFDLPHAKQDEPYVDLAAATRANFLVSRDHDLPLLATAHSLVAKQFRQRLPALRVVNPVAFLSELDPQDEI